MKWYSEEELKKWMGHTITLPLLEQMKYKEVKICRNCQYWEPASIINTGICFLKKIKGVEARTYYSDECSEGFAR